MINEEINSKYSENIESPSKFFFTDYYDPKIVLNRDRAVIEWTKVQRSRGHVEKFFVERRYGNSDWELIGIYFPEGNIVTHRFVDKTEFNIELAQKIFIISYRLKILKSNGVVEFSPEISYDLWWKKYLQFLECENDISFGVSNEIFQFVEQIVRNVFYKKYISSFYKYNLDEYYVIDEACQEIFLKLLENKNKPVVNYYSFWKYVTSAVNNWMISYLTRNKVENFESLSLHSEGLECSDEEKMIKSEQTIACLKAFSKLFNVYLDELWTTLPVCALILESWLRRKKDFLENFAECFNRNINPDKMDSELIRLDDLNFGNNDQLTLYTGILADVNSVIQNPAIRNEIYKKVPFKKRESFEKQVKELAEGDRDHRINRIKQRITRSLTIIRLKMQNDVKEY